MIARRHRGSMLVELLMSMAAGSTLMLLAIGLVHQSLTISREGAHDIDRIRTVAQLASQFRHDAHRAAEATAESETELHMKLSDESEVVYRVSDHRLTRRHELSSGQVQSESFNFDSSDSVTLVAPDEPKRAELRIVRDTGLRDIGPRTVLHVVAAVNKLARAEQGAERGAEQGSQEDQP